MAIGVIGAGARRPRRDRSPAAALASLGVVAAVVLGWSARDEYYVVAEEGLGYGLGIAGLAMMVLLLLYSLRKRLAFTSSWLPLRFWFRAHMALGLLGPLAILYHANFRLGSPNSTVALVCTLVVAASGVVGRVVYKAVYHGLSQRRIELRELWEEASRSRGALGRALELAPELERRLQGFEARAVSTRSSLPLAILHGLLLRMRARVHVWRCRRALADGIRRSRMGRPPLRVRRGLQRALDRHARAVVRVATFETWERLLALWHALHLPLCALLFASAAVHVVAVHLY